VLRARDGRLRLVPSLLEARAKQFKQAGPAPRVAIGAIELREGVLELFDATVREPAHKLRLERLQATIEDLHLPELSGRTQIQMDGMIKGVQRNGTLAVRGWAEISSKGSEITTRLHGVDLIAFEPYLVKAQETGVGRGALDLDLKSTVRKNVLRAPGTITLSDVELVSRGGTFNTFMGMPRSAFIAALKNRNGQITVKFALEGNLDDPKFSLNESFARRVASSVGETLGVSVEGLARGVGGAARGKAIIEHEVDRALDGVDALVLPALAIPAPPLGAATMPVKGGPEAVRTLMLRCSQPFNLSGHPAISLPCGTTHGGLPIGLQLAGHKGRTPVLVQAALAVEQLIAQAG